MKGKHNHERVCNFGHLANAQRRKVLDSNTSRILDAGGEDRMNSTPIHHISPPHYVAPEQHYFEIEEQNRITSARLQAKTSPDGSIEKGLTNNEPLAILMSELAQKSGKNIVSKLLTHLDGADIQSFRQKYRKSEDCHTFVDNYFRDHMNVNGFETSEIEDENTGFGYTIFWKNPVELLRNQVSSSDSRSCYFQPITQTRDNEIAPSHPMAAPMGQNVYASVKEQVMRSEDSNVFWRNLVPDGVQSFVGVGQLYSDKTSVSLKPNGFRFYPNHCVLLNFTNDFRRKIISSGDTILGYLAVRYNLDGTTSGRNYGESKYRKDALVTLHKAVENILEPLSRVAKQGFECNDGQGVERVCHFAIASYCADIPEIKDMTGIKNGISTPRTCFRCFALTKNMKNCTNAEKRTLAATASVMDEHERLRLDAERFRGTDVAKEKREKAKDLLKEKSLLGIRTVLYQFPFVISSPDLELFQIYLFEPLHNLSLGVSKMLKQACFERMSAPDLKSSVMKDANGEPKTFSSIQAVVLSAANEIMSKMKQEQPIKGLNIDYSKGEVSCNYNGFL